MVQKIKILFTLFLLGALSSSYGEFMHYGIRVYSGGVDDHYYVYCSTGGTLSNYANIDTVGGYAEKSRVNGTYSFGAGTVSVRVKITDGITTVYDETVDVVLAGDSVWIYPVRDIYILGAAPVPDTEIYDFSGEYHEYNGMEDVVITLQYLDPASGVWVSVEGTYILGKFSPLDSPKQYGFGVFELPAGITDWRHGYTFGTNLEIEDYRSSQNNLGNIHIEPSADGGISDIGGTQLTSDVSDPSINQTSGAPAGGVTVVYGAPDSSIDSSGLNNVPSSTNSAFNNAVEVAAGMRLAKPDITDAVRSGVSGLQDSIDALAAAGGGTSAATIEAGVLSAMGDDSGYSLPSDSIDETGISTNIGTLAASGSISAMGTKMEAFIDALPLPSFPAGITTVSSVSFTLSGHSYNLDFNQPMWATLRNVFEWAIHIFAFMGVLFIVRRGVA